MTAFTTKDSSTRCSTFSTADGCEETFFSIITPQGLSFSEALAELSSSYSSALLRAGLSDATAVFSRIFLSDILNQKSSLLNSALYNRLRSCCALSVIEQKPVEGGPVAMLSYHLQRPGGPFEKVFLDEPLDGWRSDVLVKGNNYSFLWTANHTGGDRFDAYAQTKAIFDSYNVLLAGRSMTLLENCVRTWIYVRDVDNHYKSMVRARREYFSANGLTDNTRFIASTGILGIAHEPEKIVSMDSLSIGGLSADQIVRMEAPSHLSPTILYGVTFERGLRVRFGGRSHLHISGTASIDNKGEVLHLGDAEAQTRRTIENVRALLDAQGAVLDDMAYFIAYVRNAHDRFIVRKVLQELLGEKTPLIFVEAAVCRPAWLVELEGTAIIADKNDFPSFP